MMLAPTGIDIYRVDAHCPGFQYPYRVRLDGMLWRTQHGEPRKFRTIAEAQEAISYEHPEIL